jgi:hypothetical protein
MNRLSRLILGAVLALSTIEALPMVAEAQDTSNRLRIAADPEPIHIAVWPTYSPPPPPPPPVIKIYCQCTCGGGDVGYTTTESSCSNLDGSTCIDPTDKSREQTSNCVSTIRPEQGTIGDGEASW